MHDPMAVPEILHNLDAGNEQPSDGQHQGNEHSHSQ
jgi:hypothetical protein